MSNNVKTLQRKILFDRIRNADIGKKTKYKILINSLNTEENVTCRQNGGRSNGEKSKEDRSLHGTRPPKL